MTNGRQSSGVNPLYLISYLTRGISYTLLYSIVVIVTNLPTKIKHERLKSIQTGSVSFDYSLAPSLSLL